MERSEPALVPEWLKTSSGTGSSNQFAPSLLHSDDHVVSKHERNRPAPSISDRDARLSSFSGQTTSSYLRLSSSSSNGSSQLRTHNSFSRVQHDQRYNDYTDPLILRRSRSSLTGRRGELYKNGNKSNPINGDSLLAGVSVTNVHRSSFERDFPSLGTEERKVGSELGRVPSPVLSTIIQSLPVGSSALIGSDGWTSALVEVHGTIESNGVNVIPPQQTASGSSPSMAETVAQSPSHAGATPLLSVKTQRLEELVMKQSKQLIPMTPSLAKTQVLSLSEKGKPKIGQQHASHSANLTLRGGPSKSDVPKTSMTMGKLQVLKPSQELNGISSTAIAKESLSPANGSRVVNSPMGTPSSVPFRRLSNNPNFIVIDNKPTPKTAEKKPSAQTKSRNDFFNLIKKKSSAPSPSTVPCSTPSGSPSALELEKLNEVTTKPDTSILGSSNGCDKDSSIVTILPPDEKEAAFLHSLGWEEGSGEDEGLTEEEINAFYELYPSFRPSMKLHGVASNVVDQLNSQNGSASSHS